MLRLLRIFSITFFETILARLIRPRVFLSWGFRFEWMIRFLRRDFKHSATWSYGRLRANLDARHYPSRALPQTVRTSSVLGEVRVVTFTPPNVQARGILLYLHGGSYIFGSPETTHADLIARLALLTRVRVVAPKYRLAPEYPYPAALDDVLAVFESLTANVPASDVVVAGDSAGGNLALAVQLALRDRRQPQANAAVLISPWLDLTASRASCRRNDAFDYGQTSFLLRHARDFAGSVPLTDPRVSPINAELDGLAPVLVQVGGVERLHDEGKEFVDRARQAGVTARLDVVAEMPHNPPAFAQFHPECERAVRRLAEYVEERLAGRTP